MIRSAVEERSVEIIWDMLWGVEGEQGSRDREVRQAVTAKGPKDDGANSGTLMAYTLERSRSPSTSERASNFAINDG